MGDCPPPGRITRNVLQSKQRRQRRRDGRSSRNLPTASLSVPTACVAVVIKGGLHQVIERCVLGAVRTMWPVARTSRTEREREEVACVYTIIHYTVYTPCIHYNAITRLYTWRRFAIWARTRRGAKDGWAPAHRTRRPDGRKNVETYSPVLE